MNVPLARAYGGRSRDPRVHPHTRANPTGNPEETQPMFGLTHAKKATGVALATAAAAATALLGAPTGDDVAVLTLSTSMPYTTASYVSSSQTSVYAAGTTARIVGWGTTSESGSSSNQLRTATVPIVSNSSCASSYGSDFVASDMV